MIVHTVKFDRPLVGATIVDSTNADVLSEDKELPDATAVATADAVVEDVQAAEAAGIERPEDPSQDSNARRDELLEEIATVVAETRDRQGQAIGQWQSLALRFASIMVKQLAGSSESFQAARMEKLIGDLVNRPELPLKIAAQPDDCSMIESCLESHGAFAEKIELVPDASVAKGECRAIYEGHDLVSRIEEQLPDIEYRLMEALQND